MTFRFHPLFFSEDDGGGKVEVQFDHCCLRSSLCSEEMLLLSFWFVVELLIFINAGYNFAGTLFVMHTQVVE